jgi:hypothetical protein
LSLIELISGKQFAEIRTIITLHRAKLIKIVERCRRCVLAKYSQALHKIDKDANKFVQKWARNSCVAVETMGGGNCLYGSVSLNLFGTEKDKHDLRVATVFMLLEYEPYFRWALRLDRASTFEAYVEEQATLGEWGDDIAQEALSVLCCRPIFTHAEDLQYTSYNPAQFTREPILIQRVNNGHFVGVLAKPLNTPHYYPPEHSYSECSYFGHNYISY